VARVAVSPQVLSGAYPVVTANSRDLAMQAGDSSLGNYALIVEGKTVILVQNTDSGAHNVTLTGVVDAFNRTGDLVYSLGAGELAIFGPFKAAGWSHGSGAEGGIWINVADATLKLANITQG
jgi:hypothetical protein